MSFRSLVRFLIDGDCGPASGTATTPHDTGTRARSTRHPAAMIWLGSVNEHKPFSCRAPAHNVAHTALLEGAAADDDRGPCVARPALCASSSSSHMLAVPSAPARSTHGPALKIPPVRLTLSRAAGSLLFFKLANRPGRGAGLSWPRLQQALRVAAGQPLGGARGGG